MTGLVPEPRAPISVLVAEDHEVVRAGIVMLLAAEPGIEVVGEAGDGASAVALAARLRPDVVLMDLQLPEMDGVAATRVITANRAGAAGRPARVLVLTGYADEAAVFGALRAGASGFVLKQAAPRELTEAVRRIAAGDAWLDPVVAGRVISSVAATRQPLPAQSERLDVLTPRERDVLVLMAEGLSNEQIVARLVLSMSTVKTHVARVIMKTASRDRAQAVVLAYECGLVTPRTSR